MSSFMLDTNCLVALFLPWHEHHESVLNEIERRLDRGEVVLIAAHTLVETYAVLTRLPTPHRLSATASRALIEENIVGAAVQIVALSADDYLGLIHDAPERAVSGGRTYDFVVATSALSAQADALLTFNGRHFTGLVGEKPAIIPPV